MRNDRITYLRITLQMTCTATMESLCRKLDYTGHIMHLCIRYCLLQWFSNHFNNFRVSCSSFAMTLWTV